MTEEEAWDEAQRRNLTPEPAHGLRDWLSGQRYWIAVQSRDGPWDVQQTRDKGSMKAALADSVIGDLFNIKP